jgi:hypothetical protein
MEYGIEYDMYECIISFSKKYIFGFKFSEHLYDSIIQIIIYAIKLFPYHFSFLSCGVGVKNWILFETLSMKV